MSARDDLRAWLTLLHAPGVGPASVRVWLGQAGAIGGALRLACAQPRLPAAARAWLRAPDAAVLDADLAWLDGTGHRLLRCDEADFPPQLEAIPDPPVALFVAGDAAALLQPQIAIVGARGATAAGLANARAFAHALAGAGLVVTSGLARGIDGAAHAAAMDAGAATVAVLGTGVDQVYPRGHRQLAGRVAAAGALVSEFLLGSGPRAAHFPRRNRIISGLSLGTLVIEAGVRSGSLITARLASEQGREVFAIPGSIHNPLARGCHRLIRDGVRLVETVDEVLQAIRPLALALGAQLAERIEQLPGASTVEVALAADPQRRHLLEVLGCGEPLALDTISGRCGLPVAEVSSLLMLLELDGLVSSQSGGRWLRLA